MRMRSKRWRTSWGLAHQVCKSHVQRNTERLVEELKGLAQADGEGSLRAIGVRPEQAMRDLEQLRELARRRQPEDAREIGQMRTKCLQARLPEEGEKARVAYQIRRLWLDRWNGWPR